MKLVFTLALLAAGVGCNKHQGDGCSAKISSKVPGAARLTAAAMVEKCGKSNRKVFVGNDTALGGRFEARNDPEARASCRGRIGGRHHASGELEDGDGLLT